MKLKELKLFTKSSQISFIFTTWTMHLGEHDQDMIIDQDEEEERNSEHFELFGLISVWPESSKSKFDQKNKITSVSYSQFCLTKSFWKPKLEALQKIFGSFCGMGGDLSPPKPKKKSEKGVGVPPIPPLFFILWSKHCKNCKCCLGHSLIVNH